MLVEDNSTVYIILKCCCTFHGNTWQKPLISFTPGLHLECPPSLEVQVWNAKWQEWELTAWWPDYHNIHTDGSITLWCAERCARLLPVNRVSSAQKDDLSSKDSADSEAWSHLEDTFLCCRWRPQDKSSWASHSHITAPPSPWGWPPCWAAWWRGPPPPWPWC